MSAFVSVIIPTFNRDKTIGRAIQSVLNQESVNFELIVVDDGSTDRTSETVKQFRDPRLTYFSQANTGRCAARNFGVRSSQGQIVTFLDSDDEALPGWLQNMAQMFEDTRTGVACCGYLDVLAGQEPTNEIAVLPRTLGPIYHREKGLFHPPGTFAIRREIFDAIGGYTEQIGFSENSELAMRLIPYCAASGWKIASLARPYVRYYRDPARHAKTEKDFKNLLQAAEVILNRHGEKLRKAFPRGYANYCGIAGVNAARLEQFSQARQFFISAIAQYPYGLSNYARLLVSLVPFFAKRFWLRHDV